MSQSQSKPEYSKYEDSKSDNSKSDDSQLETSKTPGKSSASSNASSISDISAPTQSLQSAAANFGGISEGNSAIELSDSDDDDLDLEQIEHLERIDLVASSQHLGMRADQFIAAQMPEFSRSRIQKLIEEGHVYLSEKPIKAGLKLRGGEHISITVPPIEPLDVAAEDIALDIIYQDEYLAVINKAAGMVTHPGAGVTSGTLVNALLHHMKDSLSGISGVARPGIVHRLDKDTSGLLVIAKEDQCHRHLAEQIKRKHAQRIYMALVEGVMKVDSGTIDKNIGRHPIRRKEMAVTDKGKNAVSHFQVLKRFSKYTLVRVTLETGRTHQIRVHMSNMGYPVVGDIVYNSKATGTEAARRKLGLRGQALHAFQLSFTHPVTGRLLEFEAPVPNDFGALIDSLK